MSHKFCTHIGPLKCTYVDLNIDTTLERHQRKCGKNLWVKIIFLDRHENLESYITNDKWNGYQMKNWKAIYWANKKGSRRWQVLKLF